MNPIIQSLIGPAATLLIAVAGYALWSRSREAAGEVAKSGEAEARQVRARLLEDDEHTRKLLQDDLARWENGFVIRLNGTYLRGPEAKLRFDSKLSKKRWRASRNICCANPTCTASCSKPCSDTLRWPVRMAARSFRSSRKRPQGEALLSDRRDAG